MNGPNQSIKVDAYLHWKGPLFRQFGCAVRSSTWAPPNTFLHILSDNFLHLCYEARMILLIVSSAIVGISQTWAISFPFPDSLTRRLTLFSLLKYFEITLSHSTLTPGKHHGTLDGCPPPQFFCHYTSFTSFILCLSEKLPVATKFLFHVYVLSTLHVTSSWCSVVQ
jgi:hypothetical protein